MSDMQTQSTAPDELLFSRVATILEHARGNVVRAVNSNMVIAYWLIGREIVQALQGGEERAEYGKRIIKALSSRLTDAYGKGFSVQTLWNLRLFYQTFPDRCAILSPAGRELPSPEKLSPAGRELAPVFSPQLTWSHYRALMRVQDENARQFYEQEAVDCGWSKAQLERQIQSAYYQRILANRGTQGLTEPTRERLPGELQAPQHLIKSPYVLEFLGLPDSPNLHESTLEQAIVDKCPFCGINDLLGRYHSKREAYDHYLPKALYPFNSINFRNLVSACHHCNSSYKTRKDPAHKPKDLAGAAVRRKVFYPFSTAPHAIDLQVTLQHADIENLTPADIHLTFGPANVGEQIDTWKDVYGIEEQYRGKLLGGDGKAWLVEVLDEWRWNDETTGAEGKTPDEYLRDVSSHTQKSPFANANFLKNSFLRGCKTVGLFDPIATGDAVQ